MRRWRTAVVVFVLGSAWACGSVPSARRIPPSKPPRPAQSGAGGITPPSGRGSSAGSISIASQVVEVARSLLTTPYRYAGTDRTGFDCSGLTFYIFDKVGLALPRTAQSQASAGRWIAPDELSSGDLVFFGDNRAKPHHVGLVVSEPGEPLTMIHSSSSRGVIETAVLTNSYWLHRLRFGRRVLAQ